jgi:hypothetical protein
MARILVERNPEMLILPSMMPNSGSSLPDDEEERQRQARLALMGVHSNLMGSAAGLDPNSSKYLPTLGRHITGMNLLSAAMPSPATKEDSTTIPAQPNAGGASLEPAESRPAGVMGKSSLMGNLPLTRNVQDAALLDHPAAVTMGARDRMARPAAPVAAPAPTESEMPTTLVPPEREPVLANPAPSMGARPHHSLMGKIVRGLETAGNIAGDVFFPGPMSLIPHTQLYNERQAAEAERNRLAEGRVESELMGARARMGEAEARMGAAPKERTVEINGQPVVQQWHGDRGWITESGVSPLTRRGPERPSAMFDTQTGKLAEVTPSEFAANPGRYQPSAAAPKEGHILSNPFEAFAYGTPEQKKSAQEFIDFEKRIGAKYRQPSAFDERYRLFTEHPDIYQKMYGTKGGVSVAEARMLLSYADRRERELNDPAKNLDMSDADRQAALQEVEQIRQMAEGAIAGAPGQGAGATEGNTVNVISPDGRAGTIPRRNLPKALKRGYKLANQ